MVKGLSHSVFLDIFLPKITASHRVHEGTADANFCLCFELVQIGVVFVVGPVEESQPTIPSLMLLLMIRFGDPFLPVHFCASCAIQEICVCGSLIILICGVESDGCSDVSIEIILSFYN